MKTANSEDLAKFKKLGVSSVLELSLILPKSYESGYLNSTPLINEINSIEVEVLSLRHSPKALSMQLFCKTWNQRINGVVFKPSPYHLKIFKPSKILHVRGRLKYSNGWVQIQQPQIIKNLNTITPKYKTPLRNQTVTALMKKYLSLEALRGEGLDDKRAKILLSLHNPSKEFYFDFLKRGYSKDTIEALKYTEIFSYLKRLNKKSVRFEAKSILNGDIDGFIKSLPFKLTNDQLKVINEIKNDLKSGYSAKRVIMGDVGCGKTMVMLASVMMAYPKRSLLMAPTTVLARQIYDEAKKHLPLHVKVALVTNETQKEPLDGYDFIVGTHALLYRDLPEADLVMVDEQHRFGTNQRALISNLMRDENKRVHFLQFSATPIPRTLALMHSSLVDFSYIKELPYKKEIDTLIIGKSDFSKLIMHIKSEIKKGHQIIIVYPLVEESESMDYLSIDEGRGFWESKFDKVYVTFGKDKDKEKTIEKFKRDGNILITTTVIEVGISLPRLTTIVIVAPERLGLASLHQLRGRVSRNGLKGFCYLFTNREKDERLQRFSQSSDGFEIAEIDLEYRQSGDILNGVIQSGANFEWFDISKDKKLLKEAKANLSYYKK